MLTDSLEKKNSGFDGDIISRMAHQDQTLFTLLAVIYCWPVSQIEGPGECVEPHVGFFRNNMKIQFFLFELLCLQGESHPIICPGFPPGASPTALSLWYVHFPSILVSSCSNLGTFGATVAKPTVVATKRLVCTRAHTASECKLHL